MSTDFKCKNTFEDVLDEKFALGEAMKDSEPLKSSFFMFSRVSFLNLRPFLALLCCRSCCCSSFFSRQLNVTCAGAERKKYISTTNSLLIATEQLLNTLALHYAYSSNKFHLLILSL